MLTCVACAVSALCATWDETRFEYDPSTGLPLKKIYPDGHEINYTYIDAGLPNRITYASGKWKERRYNERLQTIANVYSSANTPDVFVSLNELGTITRAEDAGGLVYDYGIRPHGQLLKTRSAVFDRWNLIYERFEDGANQAEEVEYFWGPDRSGTLDEVCGVGGLVAVSRNGSFYFPYYGTNGEILGYVSEGGIVVASYAYGPFGEPSATGGLMSQAFSFRYMTKRWDPVLGLYDFGERWYSVALKQWINRDPLGEDGGMNLYAFCNNDPVNSFDPNGCIPLDTIWDLANVAYDICVGDKVSLATDVAALLTPYVPAGATKLVKAARLSKVKKICPGAKKLEVTYEYLPTAQYKYKHTLNSVRGKDWIKGTTHGYAKFKPGWGDAEIKGLIEEAFAKARAQGKIRPSQLDGFVYDTGRIVGAADGKVTTKIKIHVNSDGKLLHAFPCHH